MLSSEYLGNWSNTIRLFCRNDPTTNLTQKFIDPEFYQVTVDTELDSAVSPRVDQEGRQTFWLQ